MVILTMMYIILHILQNAVHMEFEVEILRRYASIRKIINDSSLFKQNQNIDDLWYEKVIIPIQDKQIFITQCYAFIENQIKAFLYSRINDGKLNIAVNNVAKDKEINIIQGKERFYFTVEKKWQCLLKEYLFQLNYWSTYEYRSLIDDVNALLEDVTKLRKIRNLIVHQNGFVKSNGDYFDIIEKKDDNIKKYLFNGMYVFVNLLYTDEKGCEEVLKIAEKVVRVIKRIENIKK